MRYRIMYIVGVAVTGACGYVALKSSPPWSVVGLLCGLCCYSWAIESFGYERAMKRYEQTRAYLLKEGYIDK